MKLKFSKNWFRTLIFYSKQGSAKQEPEYRIEDIDELVADRKKFESFVYTPFEEAVAELKRRREDNGLDGLMSVLLNDMPEQFRNGPKAIFFGHATPNYEIRRFVSIVDSMDGFKTLFLEYLDDKFVTENERKFSLGKLKMYKGRDKQGNNKTDNINIIDFNSSNGKKISDIRTHWGQKLMDFHHELFKYTYIPLDYAFCDISSWLGKVDFVPSEFYKKIFLLLIRNGILFENFMLDAKESDFTKKVVLPAFIKIKNETGRKPLIVALEPTEIEGDDFWMCYPAETASYLEKKKNSVV